MDIIFLSYGNPDYLKYVLTQCASTNPDANIHLLGDESNVGYKGINHHLIKDYSDGVERFTNNYVHLCTNNEKYERFCFERWFYINNFIKKQNLKEVILLDSDVLIYDSISSDMKFFKDYRMTLYNNEHSFSVSPGQSFVPDTTILDDFCEFIVKSYTEKDSHFDKAKAHYEKLQSEGKMGGVCDMTYFYFFFQENRKDIFDLHNLLPNGHYYDLNFNATKTPLLEFKADKEGLKYIEWRNKVPYGRILDSNKEVKFMLLHFQGGQKKYIKGLVTQKGFQYFYNIHFIALKNRLRSLVKGNK